MNNVEEILTRRQEKQLSRERLKRLMDSRKLDKTSWIEKILQRIKEV